MLYSDETEGKRGTHGKRRENQAYDESRIV